MILKLVSYCHNSRKLMKMLTCVNTQVGIQLIIVEIPQIGEMALKVVWSLMCCYQNRICVQLLSYLCYFVYCL